MRNTHVGVGIGLMVGALTLQIPVAAADDSSLHIRSRAGSSGSTVTVSTEACGADVTYGKGESELAGSFHLFEGERKGVLTGRFTVPEGAGAATDTVIVKCPPRIKLTESYTLTAGRPNGAVEAGFGSGDSTASQLALGGALLAAGAAGWLVRARRRSPANRT
ncbi:LPXTG cell wall anchor domain-containing protein [Streptomyces sp. NPDC051051]|uniref:LPXTG cell wall anchor domain-containing protein n=1 Tax=Streptomyces sp. NPDC051051 TaxID=3155666 RepID=UPI003447A9EB